MNLIVLNFKDVNLEKMILILFIVKLIILVWIFHIFTVTIKDAFLAMKLIKTSIRNKIEEEFLEDYMIVYIKRGFNEIIDSDFIIDEFYVLKHCRAPFRWLFFLLSSVNVFTNAT